MDSGIGGSRASHRGVDRMTGAGCRPYV